MTNTPNTCSAVVADEASGAGALAPAPEVLTIDRGGEECSLRNLWLPAERKERRSVEYMRKAMERAFGKRGYDELLIAYCSVHATWRETVRCIVQRGGLLHIGAGV